jgi:hypothetical protein
VVPEVSLRGFPSVADCVKTFLRKFLLKQLKILADPAKLTKVSKQLDHNRTVSDTLSDTSDTSDCSIQTNSSHPVVVLEDNNEHFYMYSQLRPS